MREEKIYREITCIRCPLGCTVKIESKRDEILAISGNACERGAEYAVKEMTSPTRVVTTTVCVQGRGVVLPVKTKRDVPKKEVLNCMKALRNVKVEAPVYLGQVIVEDIAGTGVPVIATKEIGE